MRAVITIADLPLNDAAKIGFSASYKKDATDDGITDAGYLVHSLTQTLQHIAIDMQNLAQPHIDMELAKKFIRRPYLCAKEG